MGKKVGGNISIQGAGYFCNALCNKNLRNWTQVHSRQSKCSSAMFIQIQKGLGEAGKVKVKSKESSPTLLSGSRQEFKSNQTGKAEGKAKPRSTNTGRTLGILNRR